MARTNVVAVKINWPVARGLGPPVPPSPCEKLERIHRKKMPFIPTIWLKKFRARRDPPILKPPLRHIFLVQF